MHLVTYMRVCLRSFTKPDRPQPRPLQHVRGCRSGPWSAVFLLVNEKNYSGHSCCDSQRGKPLRRRSQQEYVPHCLSDMIRTPGVHEVGGKVFGEVSPSPQRLVSMLSNLYSTWLERNSTVDVHYISPEVYRSTTDYIPHVTPHVT